MNTRGKRLLIVGTVLVSLAACSSVTGSGSGSGSGGEPAAGGPAAPTGGQPSLPDRTSGRPPKVVDPASAEVDVDPVGFFSWALIERTSGRVIGSANRETGTNSTESMIKAWIGADYLAGLVEQGRGPTKSERRLLHSMIHVSDDNAAETLYRSRGRNAVVRRLISTCGLRNTSIFSGWWSKTEVTAVDAARMGACIVDRQPAGPTYTRLLVEEMQRVDPSNRFGIAQAAPLRGRPIAVKNGWTARADGTWHLNCLGVWDHWSLAVLTRYPQRLGQDYGAATCTKVTEALFTPHAVAPTGADPQF